MGAEKEGETVANVTLEETVSDDYSSETRPLPAESDRDKSASDDETAAVAHPVSAPAPLSSHPLNAALGIGRSKAPKKKPSGPNRKQLCKTCKRGFQLKRDPSLHISCRICKLLVHKRCLSSS